MNLNKSKKSLLKNTIMLYVLTFSNYILSLIIVPYETRVLGPEKYGLLGLATAVMVYFQLFIDFGFLLSATEEVANNRDNSKKLSVIFSSITINKILLSLLSLIVLAALCLFIPRWKENMLFLMLFCVSYAFASFLPDYLYRGLEQMETITIRTVLIKLFFTILVIYFVKQPKDILMIPILQLIGNVVALVVAYLHLHFKLKISFVSCTLSDLGYRMKASASFFVSRIASTVYSAANTIILDFISGGGMTAYYTSADKMVSTAKSGLSPISDSLYPYMVRNKDFKLIKKILLVLEPIIIICCAVLFIWAKPICVWFFGSEYSYTADALRALLPIIVITLPSYILGFPVLGAMGLNKHANYSVILASSIHVLNLIVLYCSGRMSVITLGIATSLAEFIVLLYRVIIVVKNKNKFII